jgi:hypothetical protein
MALSKLDLKQLKACAVHAMGKPLSAAEALVFSKAKKKILKAVLRSIEKYRKQGIEVIVVAEELQAPAVKLADQKRKARRGAALAIVRDAYDAGHHTFAPSLAKSTLVEALHPRVLFQQHVVDELKKSFTVLLAAPGVESDALLQALAWLKLIHIVISVDSDFVALLQGELCRVCLRFCCRIPSVVRYASRLAQTAK